MRLACFRLLFCGLIWLVSVGNSSAQLFPSGMDPGKYPELYSFMERYARMLLSLETSREQARQMREDGVRLRVGGVDFRDTGEPFSAVYQRIHQTKAFTLTVDSLYFKAAWGNEGSTDEIAFLFPKKYDLILGKDKKELTQGFLSELMAEYPEAETYPYPILHDSGFYWLESVRSGWFPEVGKSDGYLFDIDRKEDSLLNLFSYADRMGKKHRLHLTIRGYRYEKSWLYPLAELCAFMRSKNCVPYVGLETETGEACTGSVFYVNRDLMYQHLLYFRFPLKAFSEDDVLIEAVLTPYIPIHNIGTLYDE